MFSPTERPDKRNEDTVKLVTSTRVTVLTSAGVSTSSSPGIFFPQKFCYMVIKKKDKSKKIYTYVFGGNNSVFLHHLQFCFLLKWSLILLLYVKDGYRRSTNTVSTLINIHVINSFILFLSFFLIYIQ